jgi:very-short-patch-repair endonuclease
VKRTRPNTSGPLRKDVQATDRAASAARALRESLSPPELMLWVRIKHTRRLGYPFRRQHPMGGFVADFYCHAAALGVEVDGRHHLERTDEDRARDAWMADNGLMVLRFTTVEVGSAPDAAAATCLRIARERYKERGGVP